MKSTSKTNFSHLSEETLHVWLLLKELVYLSIYLFIHLIVTHIQKIYQQKHLSATTSYTTLTYPSMEKWLSNDDIRPK